LIYFFNFAFTDLCNQSRAFSPCTRYASPDPSTATPTWPCGNNITNACLGLSPATSFYNLNPSDTICLLPGVFALNTSDTPLTLPIGANIRSHSSTSPAVITMPRTPTPTGLGGRIFEFLVPSGHGGNTTVTSSIANITFINIELIGVNASLIGVNNFNLQGRFRPVILLEALVASNITTLANLIQLHSIRLNLVGCSFTRLHNARTDQI